MTCKALGRGLALSLVLVQFCPAQTGQPEPESRTVESWLQREMLNTSGDAKLALLTRLLNDYQKVGLVTWGYEQVAQATEADQVECTLTFAEKLIALDPKNIEIANR